MFTLAEVASLNDIQPTYRILKPWWDVFMDYLAVVMLMVAIFAGTMQLTKDQVVCLPVLPSPVSSKAHTSPGNTDVTTSVPPMEPTTDQDQDVQTTHEISFGTSAVTPDIPLRSTPPPTDSPGPGQEAKKEKKDPR